MFEAPIQLRNTPLEASFTKHELQFITPAKTSRETFHVKETYVLKVKYQSEKFEAEGECSPLWSLSIDPKDQYVSKLEEICANINNWKNYLSGGLSQFPSIQFGLETALLNLTHQKEAIIFPSAYTEKKDSIQINGLIWMGDFENMASQIEKKIETGFRCVKMKIGAINWEDELILLKKIRSRYSADEIELRVDANGAFEMENAMFKLDALASLKIHSIEQPIKAGQIMQMKFLCANTPLPIALDEELIGVQEKNAKSALLSIIKPQYIILKPSLIGGIQGSNEWIRAANENDVNWWITSALEGNTALNAIAQFVYTKSNKLPQGLGTGELYSNNLECYSTLKSDQMRFTSSKN